MAADLIVVGGGIAGCEVAYAAARATVRCLLITTSLDSLYVLAHDSRHLAPPAGSLMAASVQRVVAGASGGDAAGRRTAVDSADLRRAAKWLLEGEAGIHLLQSTVAELLVDDGAVQGVSTWEGLDHRAGVVVLAVGSFLEARLRVGAATEHAGRLSEMAYDDLYEDLLGLGFAFKGRTLDVEAAGGALPYEVSFKVFTPNEVAAEEGRLRRLRGLYATGACLGRFGYETSAEDGRALGVRLADALTGRGR